jgi:Excreted virulence factor EspC, type VII ESX diderm
MERILMSDEISVDVGQLRRAARQMGECADGVSDVRRSLGGGGARMGNSFGSSGEAAMASAEYRKLHGSITDMVAQLHELGLRHQETLESGVRCYRDTEDNAVGQARGLLAEEGAQRD